MLLTMDIKNKLWIALTFGAVYYLIFCSTSLLSGFIHSRIVIAFPFEKHIPFYPAWSIVYLSINLYLWAALFVFKRWQLLAALAIALIAETILAGIFFIIFPVKLEYPFITIQHQYATLIHVAQFMSMQNNYFPSLHTAFAFTCAFAYQKYCSVPAQIGFYIWALLIPISTLFIHEHQLMDLIAGFILAIIAYRFIFIPFVRFFYEKINGQIHTPQ